MPHGIRWKNDRSFDQPGPGGYFWFLTCVSSGLLDYLCNHQLYLQLCTLVLNSILVTTPQYQPPTKVCVANRLISEKMISCIFLILFVLAFFSLFADQFLRFCPFNLSKSFFEIRMWPLVHWLPKSSFPVVGF